MGVVLPHLLGEVFRGTVSQSLSIFPSLSGKISQCSPEFSEFSSVLVNSKHFLSILVQFSQFYAGHAGQKCTNILTTGMWAKQHQNRTKTHEYLDRRKVGKTTPKVNKRAPTLLVRINFA